MMKLTLLSIFIFLLPSETNAAGFGWYVSAIDWGDFSSHRKRLADTASEILFQSPGNKKLRQYFQEQVDAELYNTYCNPKSVNGTDLSPVHLEFYPVDFLKYGAKAQKKNRVTDSIFYLFEKREPYIKIAPRSDIADQLNPYFIIPPDRLAIYLKELKAFNQASRHSATFDSLSRHLEGVLLIAESDKYPGKQGKSNKWQTALFFCGHD